MLPTNVNNSLLMLTIVDSSIIYKKGVITNSLQENLSPLKMAPIHSINLCAGCDHNDVGFEIEDLYSRVAFLIAVFCADLKPTQQAMLHPS